MHGKPPVSASAPNGRLATVRRDWAECGRGAGSGQTYCGLLSCRPCSSPPPIQAQMPGQGRVESAAGRPPHRVLWRLAEVPCGKGQRGSLRAELQTLPTSGAALVFICHVYCDLFPVRFGLNKGSADEKRFKTTEQALAFTELIKTVDSGEGTRPVTASQAHVRGDSGVASVPSGVPSSLGDKSHCATARQDVNRVPSSPENTNRSPQASPGPQADFTWPAVFTFKNLSQLGDFPFDLESLLSLKTLNIQ